MSHVEPPASPPIDCASELVKSYRGGTLLKYRQTNFVHAWNIVGYLGTLVFDDEIDTYGAPELTDEQALIHLERMAGEGGGGGVKALPLPAALLLRWLVEKVLDELLK